MSIVVLRELRVEVPVGVSTVLSAAGVERLSFACFCEDLNTDWHITFSVPATANDGVRHSGRQGFNLSLAVPGTGNNTEHYEGPINVFVTAAAGIATVGFWIIETDQVP